MEPLRLHIAFGIGGKAYVVLTGDVAAVKAAITEGSALAAERGQAGAEHCNPEASSNGGRKLDLTEF